MTLDGAQQRATSYVLGGVTGYDGTLEQPATIEHAGYTLRLTQVTPYPEGADTDIPADAYAATFVVEASAAAPPTTAAPETVAPLAGMRPLLCLNQFAVTRTNLGVAVRS